MFDMCWFCPKRKFGMDFVFIMKLSVKRFLVSALQCKAVIFIFVCAFIYEPTGNIPLNFNLIFQWTQLVHLPHFNETESFSNEQVYQSRLFWLKSTWVNIMIVYVLHPYSKDPYMLCSFFNASTSFFYFHIYVELFLKTDDKSIIVRLWFSRPTIFI